MNVLRSGITLNLLQGYLCELGCILSAKQVVYKQRHHSFSRSQITVLFASSFLNRSKVLYLVESFKVVFFLMVDSILVS